MAAVAVVADSTRMGRTHPAAAAVPSFDGILVVAVVAVVAAATGIARFAGKGSSSAVVVVVAAAAAGVVWVGIGQS